jgi:hypothetical protein
MEPARKFKIIVNSKECGTCSGPTPSAVAKKVVKKLCGTSSKVVRFSLKECKRGCERVCGPYQGRMEKLDRPCKRSGKTITHLVVCGKVRKMRGGALGVPDFRKGELDNEFKFDKIGLRPHIFFGEVEVENQKYYEFVIFNVEHFGGNKKTCGFNKLEIDRLQINVVEITGKDIIGNGNGNGNGNAHNKDYLFILLYYLLYCEKLTDYRTIRRTIYELLENTPNLCDGLEIPHDFFKRDYLPEVITAEGTCVPKGFYKLLPEKIDNFKTSKKDYDEIKKVIAETTASKRPNFLKRTVYYSDFEDSKYIYFSKKKDSEYYNIAIVCNENNTIYIGIYNPRTGIVKFYPIDKNIFSRFTYPSDFIDLIYLYLPYIHGKYYNNTVVNSKLNPKTDPIMIIKLYEFYSEYISSTIKTSVGLRDINKYIEGIKCLQKKQREQQPQSYQRQQQLNNSNNN